MIRTFLSDRSNCHLERLKQRAGARDKERHPVRLASTAVVSGG